MFSLSYAVEVNPEGEDIVLSREQVWKGLEMKAEDARPFVPVMSRCEVLERGDGWLLREIEINGKAMKERITFRPQVQVHFERVGGDGGFIENTLSESARGLILTFTFCLSFPGKETGSEEERLHGEGMKADYERAVASTLKRVRELVKEGKL